MGCQRDNAHPLTKGRNWYHKRLNKAWKTERSIVTGESSTSPRAIMHNRGSSWPVATSTCCTRKAKSLVGAKLRFRSRDRSWMVGGRTLWKKEAMRRFRGGFLAFQMGWETQTRAGRGSLRSDFSYARSFRAVKMALEVLLICAKKRAGINIPRPRAALIGKLTFNGLTCSIGIQFCRDLTKDREAHPKWR